MAQKTVLKRLLRKWGPLSTEMEDALVVDQAGFTDLGSFQYMDGIDDETGKDMLSAPDDEEEGTPDAVAPAAETASGSDDDDVKALFR